MYWKIGRNLKTPSAPYCGINPPYTLPAFHILIADSLACFAFFCFVLGFFAHQISGERMDNLLKS